jgi:hypothetical protein
MISSALDFISLENSRKQITGFEVWWQSDLGLFASLIEAKAQFIDNDEIRDLVRAVPVAVYRVEGIVITYEVL